MALSQTLGTDLATMARRIQAQGRRGDSVLAHISPDEAALLKARGGRGSVNPATGLLEFYDYLPTEAVTVSAPAYNPPPISVPSLNIPRQQAAAQQPAELPTEAVTVSADREQDTPDTFFYEPMPQISALQAPQFSALPAAGAPANVAPMSTEAVTVPGTRPKAAEPTFVGAPPQPAGNEAPQQSTSKDVKDWLGNNSTLLTILGLGGLGAFGASSSAKAGEQAGQLQNNLAKLAAPLSAAGNTALSTTQAGGLTPQNQRALDAARAQTAQAQSSGAVSSQQATEAISNSYANLLNTQLNQALTLLNQADSYLQQAYLKGYEANVTNQANTTTFYSNLAQLAARLSGVDSGTTIQVGGK